MNDAGIRLSDAERDAAAADLGEHFAQGRLSVDEHDERLSAIWSARTRGEIAPIFHDLPSAYAGVARPAPAPLARERYWGSGLRATSRGWPTPVLAIVGFLLVVTVLTHLPFVLMGLGVFWFVALRHRGHHWHRQHRPYR